MKRSNIRISGSEDKAFIKPRIPLEDFYWERGDMVMTENYHKKRGSCCGSGCKHCPFSPLHLKMNRNLREDNR